MRVVFGGLFLVLVFNVFFLFFFFLTKRQHLAHNKACHFFDGLFFSPLHFPVFHTLGLKRAWWNFWRWKDLWWPLSFQTFKTEINNNINKNTYVAFLKKEKLKTKQRREKAL